MKLVVKNTSYLRSYLENCKGHIDEFGNQVFDQCDCSIDANSSGALLLVKLSDRNNRLAATLRIPTSDLLALISS